MIEIAQMKNKKKYSKIIGWLEFVKHLLTTQYKSKKGKILSKITQIIPVLPLYLERLLEVIFLYPINVSELLKIFKEFDFPTTDYFKEKFINEFGSSSPKHLFNSYNILDRQYTLRLMIAYSRVSFITDYINKIEEYFDNKNIEIIDYGCGVSDIGILFAKRGHKVTILDLATNKLNFTERRFGKRNLKCDVIRIKNTEKLPLINKKFDLIVATEIIEHFRYPIKLVNFFHSHLKDRGLLFNNMGLKFERERGADHLDESLEEGNSKAYWNNYWSKFKLIKIKNKEPWLFKKHL